MNELHLQKSRGSSRNDSRLSKLINSDSYSNSGVIINTKELPKTKHPKHQRHAAFNNNSRSEEEGREKKCERSKDKEIKIQDEGEHIKFEILKNVGFYEKESTAMLKSGIITIQGILDRDFGKHTESIEKESNNIYNFIKASTNNEDLKSTFHNIHKDSKNLEKILSLCLFKDKDHAIRVLFETISLIEILWTYMITYETCVLLQSHTSKTRFSIPSMVQSSDLFKSFPTFFRNRCASYSKSFQSLLSPAPSSDYVNFLMSSVSKPAQLSALQTQSPDRLSSSVSLKTT